MGNKTKNRDAESKHDAFHLLGARDSFQLWVEGHVAAGLSQRDPDYQET